MDRLGDVWEPSEAVVVLAFCDSDGAVFDVRCVDVSNIEAIVCVCGCDGDLCSRLDVDCRGDGGVRVPVESITGRSLLESTSAALKGGRLPSTTAE